MRINKITKASPSPTTMFIGTESDTLDTYNFLASYVSGSSRGDFFSTDIQTPSNISEVVNITFNGENINYISGFELVPTQTGEMSGIKALKSGIFKVSLTTNIQSTLGGTIAFWIVNGINADTYTSVPFTGKRTILSAGANVINTMSFKWAIKLNEGDVMQVFFKCLTNISSLKPLVNVIPNNSNSVNLIINEIQV
jgi:hypothetical protein